MNTFSSINPNFVIHEGFYYLEFEGEFFKGCKRCGGEVHYSHNGEHSRCYGCDNTSDKLGEQLVSREAAERWCHERALRRAQRERKAEQERLKKVAIMEANQAALKEADEEVYNFLKAVDLDDNRENNFIRSMAENFHWVAGSKPFTPNMIAAVRKIMEARTQQAAEAAAHPAPVGRVVVTGEIVSTKLVESDYGTAYKILVKDDSGFKVWCSLPKAQADEAADAFSSGENINRWTIGSAIWFVGSVNEPERYTGIKGRRITFTATLAPSADDVSFAFGSRPTKGAWL